jgi:hypothetical protein
LRVLKNRYAKVPPRCSSSFQGYRMPGGRPPSKGTIRGPMEPLKNSVLAPLRRYCEHDTDNIVRIRDDVAHDDALVVGQKDRFADVGRAIERHQDDHRSRFRVFVHDNDSVCGHCIESHRVQVLPNSGSGVSRDRNGASASSRVGACSMRCRMPLTSSALATIGAVPNCSRTRVPRGRDSRSALTTLCRNEESMNSASLTSMTTRSLEATSSLSKSSSAWLARLPSLILAVEEHCRRGCWHVVSSHPKGAA